MKTAVGALALTLGLPVLAACSPMKMGAAAVVGDDRITTSTLDRTVSDWRAEFDGDPVAERIREDPRGAPLDYDSPERSALHQLIAFRVWRQVGSNEGVTVNKGEVDAALADSGAPAQVRSAVVASGVPASYTTDYVRSALVQRTLLQRYGLPAPASQPPSATDSTAQDLATRRKQAEDRLNGIYTATAKAMKITVNPRFGAFKQVDVPGGGQTVTLSPVIYTLSGAESGTR